MADANDRTGVVSGAAGELRFKQYRLSAVSGPDSGASCVSHASELSVGTEEGNVLRLSDSTVSRHHATIEASDAGYLLRDLGSTNGTRVNDVRVQAAYLDPGALIQLGKTTLKFERLEEDVTEALSQEEAFGAALGASPAMRRIFALLPRIASSDTTVLLEGETGTGKSLIARALHNRSSRADGPFVVIDCSAIPPTLIESELFGHLKGSFTGAHTTRPGAFVAAAGGTIFLDEVGELPLEMQPKLLRALEDRTVKPVGGVEAVDLDVRVVAATNRDLRSEVNNGAFRSDLYYRLNIVRLRIPPLRERPEDIPMLVSHFYEQMAPDDDPYPPADLVANLCRQSWPGNVRELRSAVERAVLLCDPELWQQLSEPLAAPHSTGAGYVFDEQQSFREAKARIVADWETWYVEQLSQRHQGNLSQAARAARMDRNHLRELLQKHGVGDD